MTGPEFAASYLVLTAAAAVPALVILAARLVDRLGERRRNR